jgi:hypothetical protein
MPPIPCPHPTPPPADTEPILGYFKGMTSRCLVSTDDVIASGSYFPGARQHCFDTECVSGALTIVLRLTSEWRLPAQGCSCFPSSTKQGHHHLRNAPSPICHLQAPGSPNHIRLPLPLPQPPLCGPHAPVARPSTCPPSSPPTTTRATSSAPTTPRSAPPSAARTATSATAPATRAAASARPSGGLLRCAACCTAHGSAAAAIYWTELAGARAGHGWSEGHPPLGLGHLPCKRSRHSPTCLPAGTAATAAPPS